MAPFLRSVAFVPQMLAVEMVVGVEAQFVRVDIRHGDRFFASRSDFPDLLQVGKEDVAAAVADDADTRMSLGRRDNENENQQGGLLHTAPLRKCLQLSDKMDLTGDFDES